MSADAYQHIMTAFDAGALEQLEKELGVEGQQTREAAGAAVGTILEGLRRKAEQQKRPGQQKQHGQQPGAAGGGLEDLLEKLGVDKQADAPEPARIDEKTLDDAFGDIFGQQGKQDVERRFGKATKIDSGMVKKIFGAVLPIVLGALAKSRQAAPEQGGGGISLDDILGKARNDFEKRTQPKGKKPGGGILESILDKDADGDVDLGDIASIFLDRR